MHTFVRKGDQAVYVGDDSTWSIPLERPAPTEAELQEALDSGSFTLRYRALSRLRGPLGEATERQLAAALGGATDEKARVQLAEALHHARLDGTKEALRSCFDGALARHEWTVASVAAVALATSGDDSRTRALAARSSEIDAKALAAAILRTSPRHLPFSAWPDGTLARLAASDDATAQFAARVLEVAEGGPAVLRVCEEAIASAGDDWLALSRAVSLVSYVEDRAVRARLATSVYRHTTSFLVRLKCVGFDGFAAELREEFIRACMTDPNPGHRYHAAGALGLVDAALARKLADAWLANEPDDLVRGAVTKARERRDAAGA
jgi:hypothetical protein